MKHKLKTWKQVQVLKTIIDCYVYYQIFVKFLTVPHGLQVLPAPDMEPKKRRGGRRFRKMKERYGLTDMRKAANRVNFNQPEIEVLDGDEVGFMVESSRLPYSAHGVYTLRYISGFFAELPLRGPSRGAGHLGCCC